MRANFRMADHPFGGESAASKSGVLAQNPTRIDTMDTPRPLSPSALHEREPQLGWQSKTD
jgi:hypothetical protein